jgi:arsenate reductase
MLRAHPRGGEPEDPGEGAGRVLRMSPTGRPEGEYRSAQHEGNPISDRRYNVLFLCTGNSARSIIAESLLNAMGSERFRGYSAGSHPGGKVNPLVLDCLHAMKVDTEGARSKSWDEFAMPEAPQMDLVITVCDQAAGETCPVWPGMPAKAHWSAPDPAAFMVEPAKARAVIREVIRIMQRRISLLLSVPIERLDRMSLQAETRAIAERTIAERTIAERTIAERTVAERT